MPVGMCLPGCRQHFNEAPRSELAAALDKELPCPKSFSGKTGREGDGNKRGGEGAEAQGPGGSTQEESDASGGLRPIC